MSEEKKAPEAEQKQAAPEKRRTFWGYVIVLFSLSVVLILLSYGSQLRLKREMEEANQSLEERLVTTRGALEQAQSAWEVANEQLRELDGLRDRMEALEKENEKQQSALEGLRSELADEREKAAASDALWRLTELVRSKKYTEAEKALEEMEAAGQPDLLSEEGKAQIERIRGLLK